MRGLHPWDHRMRMRDYFEALKAIGQALRPAWEALEIEPDITTALEHMEGRDWDALEFALRAFGDADRAVSLARGEAARLDLIEGHNSTEAEET